MVVHEIIRMSCELLSAASRVAAEAGGMARNPGVKNLLKSLSEHEQENAARVAEWGDALGAEEREREIGVAADRFTPQGEVEKKNDDRELLLTLIAEKRRLESLFADSASAFSGGDGGVVFQRLSEDENKQAVLLQDRCDLFRLR
ncbi:MAG: hypothetical protein JXD23_15345 [Spirochaetales bacterium]|nr:hypothetical protein [Spirochaetales bacterium]